MMKNTLQSGKSRVYFQWRCGHNRACLACRGAFSAWHGLLLQRVHHQRQFKHHMTLPLRECNLGSGRGHGHGVHTVRRAMNSRPNSAAQRQHPSTTLPCFCPTEVWQEKVSWPVLAFQIAVTGRCDLPGSRARASPVPRLGSNHGVPL
jgi:hypothetical protein